MGHKEEREARQLAHERSLRGINRVGNILTLVMADGVGYWVAAEDELGVLVALAALLSFALWGMWKGYI